MLHVLLFVTIYILGFVLAIIANPAFSFALYEIVYFFSPLDRWWASYLPELRYSYLTVILMIVSLLISKYRQHPVNRLFAAPQFKWVYVLLSLYSIAWFYAVLPDKHLEMLTNFAKLVVIISVAYKLVDDVRRLDLALWAYVFGSWYLSFLIFQTGRNSFNRVEGIGTVDSPDSNGIAAAIAPSLVICLYYFWVKSSKLAKFAFAIAGVFIANALVLINSRGSFLAAAISLSFFVYYLFFASMRRNFQRALAVGLVAVGLAGVVHLADDSFIERMQSIKTTEVTVEEQSGGTRVLFWIAAIRLAMDKPFGSGFQGFDYYAPAYLPENMDTGRSRNRSVHSSWFEALSEIGYLGLLAFALVIYSSIKALRSCMAKLNELGDYENYYKVIMLQAALLCFVVSMTFMNRFRAEILYWLVLYSACAYNIFLVRAQGIERKEASKKLES